MRRVAEAAGRMMGVKFHQVRMVFDPPIVLHVIARGEVLTCDASGNMEHTSKIQEAHIGDIGALIQFMQKLDEDEIRCVLPVGDGFLPTEPWVAFQIEDWLASGRIKMEEEQDGEADKGAADSPGRTGEEDREVGRGA